MNTMSVEHPTYSIILCKKKELWKLYNFQYPHVGLILLFSISKILKSWKKKNSKENYILEVLVDLWHN